MAEMTDQSGQVETQADMGKGEEGLHAYWMAQEAIAEKEESAWVKQARKIVQRYRDERPQSDATQTLRKDASRFNILWSNVQTLLPTLYARTPKAEVERRFRDADPPARLAATLLERCLAYSCDPGDEEKSDFDLTMEAVVEDRLLPGRGVARVFYVPYYRDVVPATGEGEPAATGYDENPADTSGAGGAKETAESESDDAGQDDKERPRSNQLTAKIEPEREVVHEEVQLGYVFWEDYREGPARQWREVPWVRYRSYMTRHGLIKRFGKKKGKQVKLDYTPKGMDESKQDQPPPDLYKKAIVYEVWDRCTRKVCWYAPGTPDLILDELDDPLKLAGFFPSPNPLLSTTTNDSRIPVPDYHEYQDQAIELDNITARINVLTKALRVVGIYAGANKMVLQQLFESSDNKMIPVDDWEQFAEGGIEKKIAYLPIQQVAATLIQLYNARDRVKALLYEITGLSDILRGATVPTETLGAQELKANFATRRISPQQRKVARFARNILRLMGNVIAEHFSARTISMITGYPRLDAVPKLPPRPQQPMQSPSPPMGSPTPMAPAGAGLVPGVTGEQGPQPPQGGMPQQQPAPPSPEMQAYAQAMAQWEQKAQEVAGIIAKNAQAQHQFDEAVKVIKRDGVHGFRIDIEADSTIAPDEQQEKQSRTEFMNTMVPLLNQTIPLAQGNPPLAELAKELTLFTVRGFRAGRPLEECIEKTFDAIGKMAPHPTMAGPQQKQQGPSGQEIAADSAAKAHETETNAAAKAQDTQANAAVKVHEIQSKEGVERAKLAQQAADSTADRQLKAAELSLKEKDDNARLMLDMEQSARENERADSIAQHKQAMDAGKLT